MKCSLLSRPMTCTHDWISRVVLPGDTVVDATAGNGHDTVFLARLAGPSGQVHAFDVQEEAIRATRERLEKEGLLTSAVHLHLASHDRLAELVTGPVKAVVFNLGYLPGGDKKRSPERAAPWRRWNRPPPSLPRTAFSASCAIPATKAGMRKRKPWRISFPACRTIPGAPANTSS